MAMESFEVSAVIPTEPEDVYQAWLDGDLHAQMTGGAATGSPETGASFTAWDGYISGRNIELVPGHKIVQSWRTTQFPKSAGDSRIEVSLEAADGGTKLTLQHTDIPDGRGKSYESGWHDHYFKPMQAFFGAS